jgi:membrane associated rhomboid family serine protease
MRESTWRGAHLSSTVVLVVANVVFFLLQQVDRVFNDGAVTAYLVLTQSGLSQGYIFQLFTFQFLHGGFLHLLFNLITLWFFGRAVEHRLGAKRYLQLYLASGVIGGLLQVGLGFAFPGHFGANGGVVGASAGICGLIAAFAALDPDQIVLLNFFIPLRAKWLFLISLGISLFFVLVPSRPAAHDRGLMIAHAAHLGGLLTGWAFVRFWRTGRLRLPKLRSLFGRPRKIVRLPRSVSLTRASSRRRDVPAAEDLPPAEFMSQEVDPILDKISAHGIHSLTEREKRILEAARQKMG